MKSLLTLKTLFFGLSTLLIFGSCTRSVSMRVMRPAVIDVPKDIQSLTTANRFKPDKQHRVINILEGIISGEGIGVDRRSAEACLEGFSAILMQSPRYKYSQLAVDLKGTGTANFPDPLPASEVKDLCARAKAEGLVTIEAFDSDSRLDYGTKVKKETRNNETVDVTYHTVNAGIRVTVGWRLYRASDGTIIDQFRMVETVNFFREGRSREEAASRLPSQEAMTQEIGRVVGNAYATRISPAWFWVSREFFGRARKSPQMKLARGSAMVQDWEGAARIWRELTNSPDVKLARKAMFNMAVASEFLNDLPSAIDWSERAYKMGLNRALSYNGELRQRLFEQQRLENQLSKPEEQPAEGNK